MRRGCAAFVLLAANVAMAVAQRPGVFRGSLTDPAIQYSTGPTQTAIHEVNQKLAAGTLSFQRDEISGYLRPALEALHVPIESQVLVYTKTSLQASSITPENPRAIYFNDDVAVAFVRGAPLLEAWAQDPRLGTIFYTLDQTSPAPAFTRETRCLTCHISWETLAVPGPFVLTTFPRENDVQGADGFVVDHRDALTQRWGGWYVTGKRLPLRHMGNLPLFMTGEPPETSPDKSTLTDTLDLAGYPAPYSDVVAHMVLEHQTHAMNLMTLAGWEARVGDGARVLEVANELADYMLFVGEARIADRIEGSSGFAEKFSRMGPKDSRGRSLRELQLDGRLMKYPLSYMIYSPAFNAMPPMARDATLARLREVLSGDDTSPKYAHLTPEIRQAIVEILQDTNVAGLSAF